MTIKPNLSVCVALIFLTQVSTFGSESKIAYNRDIRPILAANCFECHGPDEKSREAELRLDTQSGATKDLGGHQAIKPGDVKHSELIRRITSKDPDERMPPADSGKSLTAGQVELLRRWIVEGAKYERHWSFIPPKQPPIPKVNDNAWPRNDIDRFILARLEAAGLAPTPEADRYTLVRRLYLDLIGLPPTSEEADAFVKSDRPRAYEELVDRLLKSKHYGERWARLWLDLARYSDTNGYEKDRSRSIWPYRDWVIRALNDDMPFDQFTIEQLAGDMLPNATIEQRIASGFHRNTMLNEEGGIDPLEYRFYAMVDRVATTGTVWMGLTTGCAQCHSHKYDPISHTDYYRLMALLNNADEPDVIVPDVVVAEQRRKVEEQIKQLEANLPNQFPPTPGDGPIEERRKQNLQRQFAKWVESERSSVAPWIVLRPHRFAANSPKLELLDDGSIFSSGDITKRDVFTLKFRLGHGAAPWTALRLEVLPDDRLPARGPGRAYYEGRKGDFFLSEVIAKINDKTIKFNSASHSYGKISIGSGNAHAENVIDGKGSTGWSTSGREGERHQLVLNFAEPLIATGEFELVFVFERHFAASLGRFRLSATSAVGQHKAVSFPIEIERLLAHEPRTWTEVEHSMVKQYYLRVAPQLAEARKDIEKLRSQLPPFPTTMVMQERPVDNPRKTFRHHRGEYLSPREAVTPNVPQSFLPQQAPRNRLDFARWLASKQNPLIGRVTVNRAWQAFFGTGIVRSASDLGTQSDAPTHPDLLDWLSCEFVDQGWSKKKLHRLIVTSATYRQTSRVTPKLLRIDPNNRLLARGPRVRVDAEIVRDIVLTASGLLSSKIGGPSVYPPQPASVTGLAYGNVNWNPSAGEDRYRRSLYTFSKRTAPFAAYTVFDGPTGENCVARRARSNTPLQALTLLNDEMFLESSRALARKATAIPSTNAEHRAELIFRRLLTRPPSQSELAVIVEFYQTQKKRFEDKELDATKVGKNEQATPEFASWVMVSRTIMNLDETITKQ